MDSQSGEFDPIRFLHRIKTTWHQNCLKDHLALLSNNSHRELEIPLKSCLKRKVLITPIRNIFCKSINCVYELDRTFARFVDNQISRNADPTRKEFNCPNCNVLLKVSNFGVDKELEAIISCLLLSFSSLNSFIKVYLKIPEYIANPSLDKQNIYEIFRFEADNAMVQSLNISSVDLNMSLQELNSSYSVRTPKLTSTMPARSIPRFSISLKTQESTVTGRVNRWQERLSPSPNRSVSPHRVNRWETKKVGKASPASLQTLSDPPALKEFKSLKSAPSVKSFSLSSLDDDTISIKSTPSTVGFNEAVDILQELEGKTVAMKVTRHASEQASKTTTAPTSRNSLPSGDSQKVIAVNSPNRRASKWEEKKKRELNLLKLLKPVWSYVGNQLRITQDNFFSPYSKRQLLHYFQEKSRNLCILDLELFFINKIVNQQIQFYKIALNIPFKIPENHCSIIDPLGDIYLIGGCDSKSYNELDYIMKYDEYEHTLQSVGKLIQKRSGHAVCITEDEIFIVGGYCGDTTLKSCEVFNYMKNKVTAIADMNLESAFSCVTNFGNKYIFKFGGRFASGKMNEAIERYDRANDYWEVVCLDITKIKGNKSIKSTCLGAGIQINSNELFFFGGCYDFFGEKSNQSFTVEIDETDFSKKLNTVALQKFNMFALPIADRFDSNNQVIIFEGTLFCLQNQYVKKGTKLTPSDRKRVLFCDGLSWSLLEF